MLRSTFIIFLFALMSCTDDNINQYYDIETTLKTTGFNFSQLVVEENYSEAWSMLTEDLKTRISASDIEKHYTNMIAYGDGPAQLDGFYSFIDQWPDKKPKDIGWIYISISGANFVEAVTLIIADEDHQPKIRDIEWGRP